GLSPLALNLAYVLVKAGRLAIVDQMAEAYNAFADDRLGIVHARLSSAVPIGGEEQGRVEQWLEEYSGKKVVLESTIDPQLLGGLVIRMGDKVFDASVRTRLERLKRNLLRAGGGA
ncbi:MAG: ATP synthase F1 subunit delta, partial [Chloroflexi bacterium]|nr:ATP synthase F1 subunit delta [Chloroflexota bacterium]